MWPSCISESIEKRRDCQVAPQRPAHCDTVRCICIAWGHHFLSAIADPIRSRRGRPSKADTAAIDVKILDAAWDAFVEFGFEAATMEMIAERAGVGKATLYLRHSAKADLLRATTSHRRTMWRQESMREDWMLGDTLEQRLTSYAINVLRWSAHPEVLAVRHLVQGTRGEAAAIARELDRINRDSMLLRLAHEIAVHSARDRSLAGKPYDIARMFIGMLESLIDRDSTDDRDPARQRAIATQVVAIIMRGRAEW